MQLETLVRHIAGADAPTFRQVALLFLKLRGFRNPALADGKDDGGGDIRVYTIPPNPLKLGVQVSVEWNWKGKIKEDAEKIKSKLGLTHLHYVTSRRINETDFSHVRQQIQTDYGVEVVRYDSQVIASDFYTMDKVDELLRALGLHWDLHKAPVETNLKRSAAHAYVFFGNEARTFRDQFLVSTIRAICFQNAKGVARTALIENAGEALGYDTAEKAKIGATLDRLLQERAIVSHPETKLLTLCERDLHALTAQGILKDAERKKLLEGLTALLGNHLNKDSKKAAGLAESILEDLGALTLNIATFAVESDNESLLSRGSDKRSAAYRDRSLDRLRHLETLLESAGISKAELRKTVMLSINKMAAESPLIKDLMACELYLALSAAKKSELANALGATNRPIVVLDSSVAIPLLCCRLHGRVPYRYFSAADLLYEQLKSKDIERLLPKDYLEEAAAHLFLAWHAYRGIAAIDSSLTGSENAYVAHFAALNLGGQSISFSDYVADFGLDDVLKRSSQRVAIEALKPRLERIFNRYGIPTKHLPVTPSSFKPAQEAISQAINTLGLARLDILHEHDIRTLAYLNESAADARAVQIWCSWDSLCFWLHKYQQPHWVAFDPALLGDLLEVIRGDYSSDALSTPIEYAYIVTSEDVKLSARIWDTLAKIEKENLSDAAFIRMAENFKKNYLAQKKQGLGREEIGTAWVEWKKINAQKS